MTTILFILAAFAGVMLAITLLVVWSLARFFLSPPPIPDFIPEFTPERPYFSPSVADRLALAHAREVAEHRQAMAGTWVESPDKGGK